MQEITLKNGAREVSALVATVMLVLRSMFTEEPILFYELVMLARDRDHRLFGNSGEALLSRSLVERRAGDGVFTLHDSVRSIVLAAVEGDDLEMRLVDPVA